MQKVTVELESLVDFSGVCAFIVFADLSIFFPVGI